MGKKARGRLAELLIPSGLKQKKTVKIMRVRVELFDNISVVACNSTLTLVICRAIGQ
jgi:hypothetical protein